MSWVSTLSANGRAVTHESTLKGSIVATQKCLFREIHGNLLGNGGVRKEHELGSDSIQPGLYIESSRDTIPPGLARWHRREPTDHSQ